MYTLFLKEIKGFFSSLTGYVVLIIFSLSISLFMWVIPMPGLNVLEKGTADLDTLFLLAPWVFLFLIPAITMRMFAEEKKSGTIELLLTRPLSDLQIVLAKFFAGIVLVALSLLPCLVYFYTVSQLGFPKGNIDAGATWGALLGLFMLASIYVSIGIFSSSLTDNQIISFLLSAILSFIVFLGFDLIGSLSQSLSIESILMNFGINEHYKSISRGVLDIKDMGYFIGVAALFIIITKTVLESRKWKTA